jgi:CRISPR/Cas system-associated endonuclease Cas1
MIEYYPVNRKTAKELLDWCLELPELKLFVPPPVEQKGALQCLYNETKRSKIMHQKIIALEEQNHAEGIDPMNSMQSWLPTLSVGVAIGAILAFVYMRI